MSRALVVVGHGSHFSAASSTPVHAAVRSIRALGGFDEVRVAFWKEEPALSRAFDGLKSDDITVVPFFISSGYFTSEVIPREMRLDGRTTLVSGRTIRYTEPIGAHPGLANVIVQRAREAGATDSDALAVLGHGTPRHPDSERNVYLQAERIAAMNTFPEVATIFLDQEPNMRDVFHLVKSQSVVVVPLFVADGWHVGETIPEDLALDGAETRRDGRRLVYAAAVGTHPSVFEVILEIAEAAARW